MAASQSSAKLSCAIRALLFMSACSVGQIALAQAPGSSDAVPSAASAEGTLEEVVVTAQRREENLQKTPVAISAVSEDALTRAGVNEFTSLDKVVPEVQVERVVSMARVQIRGIFATNLSPTSEPPNAVHLDGIFLPRASALGGQFFDIDRMEVLKGPQGTLYGRNSNGGAINIITVKPGKEFTANGEIELGDYGLQRFSGGVTLPMFDTLTTRIAYNSYKHDGYYVNGLEDASEQSVRLTTIWTPEDHQKLMVIFDQEKLNNRGYGVPNGVASPDPRTIIPPTFDNTAIYGDDPPFFYRSNQNGYLLQYDLSWDFATWTTEVGHREQRSSDFIAGGINALDAAGQFTPGATVHQSNYDMTSLETRLTSASTLPVSWVVGFFAMHLEDSGGINIFGNIPASPENTPLIDQGNPYQLTHAYAAFAQGTYTPEALDKLHLTVGGRYTIDEKHAITTTTGALIPTPGLFDGTDKWTAGTWRVALSYDVTPTSLVYGSVSRGAQPGGFAFAPVGLSPEYSQEFVTAYELGSKSRFLDDRLQVNVDAFYTKYKDLSTVYSFLLPPTPGVSTIPALEIGIANGAASYKGGTVDVQWAITPSDRVNGALTYLDAVYGDYDLSKYAAGNPIAEAQLFQLQGTRINTTPPWSAIASYDHTWIIGEHELDAQLSGQYRHKMQTDLHYANTPNQIGTYVNSLDRFDFSLRYGARDQKWYVSAYVHNLANHVDYYSKSNDGTGIINGLPMVPRTFGAIIGARY